MFDNLTPNQNNTPSPITPPSAPMGGGSMPPAQPEDMFAAVNDLPAKPGAFQPKGDMLPVGFENTGNQADMKKYFMLIVIVLVVILLLAGAFISYKYFFKAKNAIVAPVVNKNEEQKTANQEIPAITEPQTIAPVENQNNVVKEPETPAASTPEPAMPSTATSTTETTTTPATPPSSATTPIGTLDSDQDGLTDEEEKALGTDATKTDSDNDGLFDREEVKTYKTNPLNADTDGDGFLDGEEVKKGFNPLGPGKLYEIK